MSEQLTRKWHASIQVETPVHVGDGRGRLVEDVDYLRDGNTIYLIDVSKLWERIGEEQLDHWNEPDFRLSDLLRPEEYASCAAAVLTAAGPLETGTGLINQLANVHGQPYLPGSTLKGAIRTALLRTSSQPFDLAKLGSTRSWAGQPIERSHFGRDPNHDLLRTLRIADTTPLEPSQLAVFVATTYSLRGSALVSKGPSYRLNVVAIRPKTRCETTFSLDTWTRSQESLRAGWKATWFDAEALASRCNRAAGELIDHEQRFYAEVGLPNLADFYQKLGRHPALSSASSFLVPVGWGTGWLGKTIGPGLLGRPDFSEVRASYRLGRSGAPFPKTRRLIENRSGQPVVPPGWLSISLQEVKE